MTLLVDHQIQALVEEYDMIGPFHDGLVEKGVISYGLSSIGYDCRIGSKGRIYTNVNASLVDPKNMTDESFVNVDASERGYFIIPPNSYMLAATVEYFKLPRWVTMTVWNKSSYARCAICAPGCVGEPGWHGILTLEISNLCTLPVKVYANEGIAQLLFFTHAPPKRDYGERKGKYQFQEGITLPKIKGE